MTFMTLNVPTDYHIKWCVVCCLPQTPSSLLETVMGYFGQRLLSEQERKNFSVDVECLALKAVKRDVKLPLVWWPRLLDAPFEGDEISQVCMFH